MPGFLGSVSFSQRNLFGLNQKLSASAEVGQIDKTFKLSHHDPWVRGDPHHTSRTISIQNNRAVGTCAAGCIHKVCVCPAVRTMERVAWLGVPWFGQQTGNASAWHPLLQLLLTLAKQPLGSQTTHHVQSACRHEGTTEGNRLGCPLPHTCLRPACAGNAIHGKAPDELGPQVAQGVQQEGNVMVGRITGGVEYSRPLSTGWSGSLGLNWQRSGCTDDKGVPQTKASRLWVAWDVDMCKHTWQGCQSCHRHRSS